MRGFGLASWAGLRRHRIDLRRGTATVLEIATEVHGHLVVGPPKTRAARRTIGIPRAVLVELEAHLAAYVMPEPDALILPATEEDNCDQRTFVAASGDRPHGPPV
jgi:hypothetical protein